MCQAVANFMAADEKELSFAQAELLVVMATGTEPDGWLSAINDSGQVGLVPAGWMRPIKSGFKVIAAEDQPDAAEDQPDEEDALDDDEAPPDQEPTITSWEDDARAAPTTVRVALADFEGEGGGGLRELSMTRGDEVRVLAMPAPDGWLLAKTADGELGIVPASYLGDAGDHLRAADGAVSHLADPQGVTLAAVRPFCNRRG